MAENRLSGDFAYLFEDPKDDSWTGYDEVPEIGDYEPPPPPWHQTTLARIAMGAIGVAVVGILVSSVLLVFDQSRGPTGVVPSTTVTNTVPAAETTPPVGPLPPGPPPPPPETASPVIAPTRVAPSPPRPTKEPEIGVTRTPVTRSPISVAPNPRVTSPRQ